MTTNRTPLQRSHRIALTHAEKMSLEFGELSHRRGFPNKGARRAAWFAHRDELLRHCRWGQRPAGFWDYECPVSRPRDSDYRQATLYENGLLSETEVTELTALWRADFEKAQAPGFAYCIGHAKPGDTFASWLHGEAAKKAHYKWAGIPKSLLRKWMAARKRQGKRIRELAEAVEPPAPAA